MLSLNRISKRYDEQVSVLHEVNLELERGEFLYVLGGTGAGKTTLLRLLATEEAPSGGSLRMFGYELNQSSSSRLQSVRKQIGYIPQDLKLVPDLSVRDNLRLSLMGNARRKGFSAQEPETARILQELGLADRLDLACSSLSGGEKQRVAVARALLRKPDMIVADEPTGAQDPEHTWAMMQLLDRANRAGSTMIIATHDSGIVRRFRRRHVTLEAGRVQKRSQQRGRA